MNNGTKVLRPPAPAHCSQAMHGQRADCVVQICIAPTTLRSGPRRPVDRAFSRAHRQRSITRVLGGLLQNRRALLGAHPGRDVDLEPSSRCRAAGAGHRQPGPDRSRADRSRTARGAQCQRPAGRHESRRLVFRVRQAVGTALVSGAPRLAAYIRRSASAMTASAVSAGDGAAIPIEAEATPMPSTSAEILPPRRPARRSTDAAWTMARERGSSSLSERGDAAAERPRTLWRSLQYRVHRCRSRDSTSTEQGGSGQTSSYPGASRKRQLGGRFTSGIRAGRRSVKCLTIAARIGSGSTIRHWHSPAHREQLVPGYGWLAGHRLHLGDPVRSNASILRLLIAGEVNVGAGNATVLVMELDEVVRAFRVFDLGRPGLNRLWALRVSDEPGSIFRAPACLVHGEAASTGVVDEEACLVVREHGACRSHEKGAVRVYAHPGIRPVS